MIIISTLVQQELQEKRKILKKMSTYNFFYYYKYVTHISFLSKDCNCKTVVSMKKPAQKCISFFAVHHPLDNINAGFVRIHILCPETPSLASVPF